MSMRPNKFDSEEVVFLELSSDKETVITRTGSLDGLPEKFILSPHDNYAEKHHWNIYRKDARGTVRIVVKDIAPSFQGVKARARAAEIYLSLIPKFKQIEASQRQSFDATVRRFAHNLIRFQVRFKEPFERLMSEKARGRPFSELKAEVQTRIANNISSAADDVATLSLRATDLDAQIETLRVIGGYADNTGSFLSSNLKKAMYRLTNPFVQELSKKNVAIVIDIAENPPASSKVSVVHNLFNVSIWQLFDNASKYVLPGTIIEIKMDTQSARKKLLICMTSVTIDTDEYDSIFREGIRGRHARKMDKSGAGEGTGIGLFTVRKALKLMNAKIQVTNEGFVSEYNGDSYSKHIFMIEFHS